MKRRTFDIGIDNLEVRADEGGKKLIRGHAAVFNQKSLPIWRGFRELIRPGAFAKTIQEADIRALVNHDTSMVLGRNKAGTLTLQEDQHGLYVEIDPPDTSYARDLIVSLERGDINQFSFGFQIVKSREITENNREDGKSETLHEILEVRLFEVSVVTFPAYPQTNAKYRNEEAEIDLDALSEAITSIEEAGGENSTIRAKGAVDVVRRHMEFMRDLIGSQEPEPDHSDPNEPSDDTRKRMREIEVMKLASFER
jgi:HK97 family phage prohead protease